MSCDDHNCSVAKRWELLRDKRTFFGVHFKGAILLPGNLRKLKIFVSYIMTYHLIRVRHTFLINDELLLMTSQYF